MQFYVDIIENALYPQPKSRSSCTLDPTEQLPTYPPPTATAYMGLWSLEKPRWKKEMEMGKDYKICIRI